MSTIKTTMYILGLVGTLGTWGRAVADGTLGHLFHALHDSTDYLLPGTSSALIRNFTGVFPVDYLLAVLVVFFWEAADGSHPTTSAIGIYFLGQLLPIIVCLYLDYARAGSSERGYSILRPSLWLLAFQMFTLGTFGFIWAVVYIGSSPTVSKKLTHPERQRAALLVNHGGALAIIPALLAGYVVPAICMALPSPTVVSNQFQQLAIVAWNVYPLLTLGLLFILRNLTKGTSSGSKPQIAAAHAASPHAQQLCTVRLIAVSTLVISAATHIGICAISFSSVLLPTLFRLEFVDELSPWSLFVPPLAVATTETVGDGVRSFLLWDQVAGYLTVISVMWKQLMVAIRGSGRQVWWIEKAVTVALSCAIMGPGSTCLVLSWWRDEILFSPHIEEAGKL